MLRAGFSLPVLAALSIAIIASHAPAADQPIADFTLRDFHGKEHTLGDYARSSLCGGSTPIVHWPIAMPTA